MKGRRVLAVAWARSLEFLRDRSTLGWNLLFPLLMVTSFAVVFSGSGKPLFKVGVISDKPIEQLSHPFLNTPQVYFYRETDRPSAIAKVARHRVDFLVDLRERPGSYWVNDESPKGVVVERLLAGAGAPPMARQPVSGRAVRYVDWVVPGLLGMNMMFSCLFGIGYVIVRYRKSGFLKRLNATPLTAIEFISAQLLSRLGLVMTITCAMFGLLNAVFGFLVVGSYIALFIVTVLGAVAMTAMGLMVASRVTSEELAGGLLNLLTWPMMILSGVFFSLDGAPDAVQALSGVLPLTHLLEAARGIMLDGETLVQVADHLLVLAGMSVVFLGVGAAAFRWTPD